MPRTSRRLGELIRNTGSDRLVPVLQTSGPGNTVELERDDLKPEIITRLSNYASAVTVATQNEFPVTNLPSTFGLEDGSGNPLGLRPAGENGQLHYSEKFERPSLSGISAETEFNRTSNSGFLDVQENGGGRFLIKKGRSSIEAPTGTEIFQEINDQGERSQFVKRVRQVQLDNNNFTLGKTYIPRTGLEGEGLITQTPGSSGTGTVSEDDSNIGVAYSQQEFGKHGPRKFPTTEGGQNVLLKIKDLKKIGLLTMLEASGEYYIPSDPNDVAQMLAARGAALAPGLARVGQKINMTRISPVKIMKKINPNFEKPNLDDNITKEAVLSYGSVNNWMTPFAGLSSTASIACAALLTLTIGGLIKAAALIVAPRQPSEPVAAKGNPSIDDRRRRIGSYLGKADQVSPFRNTDFSLRVVQTNHDFSLCVSRGIDIFFGVATPGLALLRIAQNHGYYNTVLRSLVRGTRDMIMMAAGGIVNPAGVTSVDDVTLLGNPMGPIELIQKLNESQLLKFCNIMATIGDIALSHQEDGFVLDEDGSIGEFISEIDRIIPDGDVGPNGTPSLNPAVLQSINRLPGKYRNALAWGSNTAKSMYMIPPGFSRAESVFLGAQDQSKNPSEALIADLTSNQLHDVKGPTKLDGNRISAEDVKAMEEHLEADYMPFYFHDIRTNEIISFHAFLEDMSDSFDADYTDVEGYGRIGAVHIYKNTKRNISLGFRIVATNHKDFDHMWYKINKLITLVYPQYTEGRQIGTATDKFIQPFSQLPSASPMIRLRLGDLFKSNYSKFALARLFGVGSSQFSLQGQEGTVSYNASLLANREQVTARMNAGIYHVGEFATITPLPPMPGARGVSQRIRGYPRVGDATSSPGQPGQAARTGAAGRTGAGVPGFISTAAAGAGGGGRAIGSVPSPGGAPLMITSPMSVVINREPTNTTGLKTYRFTIPGGGVGQDGVYACSEFDLTPDPKGVTQAAYNQGSSQNTTTTTNAQGVVSRFFDSSGVDGNPIIKAFESTKGKGLAGFIKSLKFDWSDARWETGRQNARAPMSVKVSMEFAPIYDITPGLDSDGFMTAPVYNTGDTIKAITQMPDEAAQNNADRMNMARADNSGTARSGNGTGAGGSGAVGRV